MTNYCTIAVRSGQSALRKIQTTTVRGTVLVIFMLTWLTSP